MVNMQGAFLRKIPLPLLGKHEEKRYITQDMSELSGLGENVKGGLFFKKLFLKCKQVFKTQASTLHITFTSTGNSTNEQ